MALEELPMAAEPWSRILSVNEPLQEFPGAQIPRGRMTLRTVPGRLGGKTYVYLPMNWHPGGEVLVAVHGISRNARELVQLFAPAAARCGFAIVAPLFTRDRYPDYQRLGLEKGKRRADDFLNNILDAFAGWTGARAADFHLFGFSGGAQFAHRYALFHPSRVRALVLGAAGWYTMPDERHVFPLGLAEAPLPALVEQRQWLGLPMLVVVGSQDTERDDALRQTPHLDATQGMNRLERAQRFVLAMRETAARYGIVSRVEFALLQGVGHEFSECMTRGGLADQALPFLGLTGPSFSGDRP
jgi:pimeloyl-ACP methyl ester carboxylesterase